MKIISRPEELIQSYIDAYNRFDLDGMCALLAPSIRFEHYADGVLGARTDGLDEFRLLAETGAAMFAERAQRITMLRVDGNHAVVGIAFTGTFAKDIPGGPAAGTVVALDGASEFVFDAGFISQIVDRS
ncbi:MAG TPA: nuclear transport factor 2 family protein [Telluria sp.]